MKKVIVLAIGILILCFWLKENPLKSLKWLGYE